MTNTGTEPVSLTSVTGTADLRVGTNCAAVLPGGSACTVTVVFAPAQAGPSSGEYVRIQSSAGTRLVNVSGFGQSPLQAQLSGSPEVYGTPDGAFGSVDLGTSASRTFYLRASGNAGALSSSARITGTHASQFTLTQVGNYSAGGAGSAESCGTPAGQAADCTAESVSVEGSRSSTLFEVTFAPTGNPGARSAMLSFAHNGTSSTAMQVSLSGVASGAAFETSASSLNGFTATVGQSSAENRSFMVYNAGNVPLTLQSVSATGDFSVSSANCSLPVSALDSCLFQVTYQPQSPASAGTGSVQVVTSVGTKTIALTGGVALWSGLSMGAATLNFNPTDAQASSSMAVQVLNAGNVPVTPSFSTNSPFFTASHNCATLGEGESCLVNVTFAPVAGQSYHGVLTAAAAGAVSQTVSLNGTGLQSLVNLNRTDVAFGNVNLQSTATQLVTVHNSGNKAADLSASALSAPFSLDATSTCTSTLLAGGTCTYVLAFAPVANGAATQTFTVTAAGEPTDVALSATGVSATFEMSTTSLSGFNALVGGTSTESRGFMVYSTGNLPVALQSVTVTSGTFTVASPDCALPQAALSESGCTFNVTYAPTHPATNVGGVIAVTTSVGQQAITLSGANAVQPAVVGSAAFGDVAVGSTGTVSLSYSVSGPVAATGVTASLDASTPATVSILSNTCSGVTVAASSCTVSLRYQPTAGQSLSGAVLRFVASNTNPVTASLTGRGLQAVGVLSGSTDFGAVSVGQSGTTTLTYTNNGNTPATNVKAQAQGPGVTADTNTCSNVAVAAGASCSLTVRYAPAVPGALSGASVEFTADNAATLTAPLTGSGAQAIGVVTGNTAFGNVAYGNNAATTLTYTNNGNTPATNVRAVLAGGASPTVSFMSNSCSGSTVAVGSTCVVGLRFTPNGPMTLTAAAVNFTSDNAATVSAALSGTGLQAVGVVSGNAHFGSVNVGSSADLTLTYTNTGNTTATNVTAAKVAGAPASVSIVTTTCSAASVTSGGSCTATVRFQPTVGGELTSAGIQFTSGTAATVAATLTGTGTQAVGSLTGTSDFGNVQAGSAGVLTLHYTNVGNAPATNVVASLAAGTPSSVTITSNGCSGTISPTSSCSVSVRFQPSTNGALSGAVLNVTSSSAATVSRPLTGQGQAPVITASGSNSFGAVAVNSPSSIVLTYTNNGQASAYGVRALLSDSAGYTVTIQYDSCSYSALHPGSSCQVSVQFTPNAAVSLTGVALELTGSNFNKVSTPLVGYGVAPIGSIIGSTDFGEVTVGQSAQLTLSYWNLGSGPISYVTATLVNAPTTVTISSNSCGGQTLSEGQGCSVVVRFSPDSSNGVAPAQLQVSGSNGGLAVVSLQGTSTGPTGISFNGQTWYQPTPWLADHFYAANLCAQTGGRLPADSELAYFITMNSYTMGSRGWPAGYGVGYWTSATYIRNANQIAVRTAPDAMLIGEFPWGARNFACVR